MEHNASSISSWATEGEGSGDTQLTALTKDDRGVWTSDDELHATIRSRDCPPGPYLRGGLLGKGGWSCVYKVRRLRDGDLFAGKASTAMKQLRREATILRALSHSHIVKYVDWYQDATPPTATLLVTELCLEGTLQAKIDHLPNGASRLETIQVILQCSKALEYIHNKRLYHSDIKPRNILVRTWDPVNVAIGDCADIKPNTFTGKVVGTPSFWSPYIVKNSRHEGASDDVWALGISLLGLMAQWPKVGTKEELKKYPQTCFEHAQKLERLNKRDHLVYILCRMLAWEAKDRASSTECVDKFARSFTFESKKAARGDASDQGLGIKTPKDFRPISFW
ncbi:kinase-like domain-containing protein [Thelonectria olida]|uniref:Kinase-like domain-containing protein n=1 Tax=Thelonectria olida TaxID=1576542 RepID=A0A9P8VZM8_9HYPO|nr:kinase-like domain-containing protein [Thelonectria olida]